MEQILALSYVTRNLFLMLRSFADKHTERLWVGQRHGFPPDLAARALSKLSAIDAATDLNDLRVPPSNHLKTLKGDRKGEYSIRVNNQWRICFRWERGDAINVELTDYH